MWIKRILNEPRVKVVGIPIIYYDKFSACCLAKKPILHSRVKYVEIDFFFRREKVMSKEVVIEYTPNEEQIDDIMTKPLPIQCF